MPTSSAFDGPWTVPSDEFGHALRFWVEAVVGAGWAVDPVAVAKCTHCDDVVFSVDGGWVMADMTTVDPSEGAPLRQARIRHFSNVRAVLDAMTAHDLAD